MKKAVLWMLALFFMIMPLANAATLAINANSLMFESGSYTVNLTVTSSTAFNGTILISYTNLASGASSVTFSSADFSGTQYETSISVTAGDQGSYTILGTLMNSSGSILDTESKIGTINSSAPKVLTVSPTGTLTTSYATLIVTTDEAATCRFDKNNGTYSNMGTTFVNTGTTKHNHTVTGLTEGLQIYYVMCKDSAGNEMKDAKKIQFNADIAPTASIKLSDTSPVRAGTVEIELTVSENLESSPSLQYSLDGSSKTDIPLEGSGTKWKGYMIIRETDNNKIGTFYFSAIDAAGNVGTKITSGNIFLVDTEEPPAPVSLNAEVLADGSVRLEWYYDGEDAGHYSIYRSTSKGVTKAHFLSAGTANSEYTDTSAEDKVTYYYAVSAVDEAGNEGPLSSEIYATSLDLIEEVKNAETAPAKEDDRVLPPDLVPKVDVYAKRAGTTVLDIESILKGLDSKSGEEKVLVEELKLLDEARNSKARIEAVKARLESYKKTYMTSEELDAKLADVDKEMREIEANTPNNVALSAKTNFVQALSKADIESAVGELINDLGIGDDEKSKFVNLNNKWNEDFEVNVEAKSVTVNYMDGKRDEQALVKKKISYKGSDKLNDVLIIETIPKAIAETASEINFLGQTFEVLNDDPVVKFGFVEFAKEGEEIKYKVKKNADPELAKESKTVMLLSLNELSPEASQVTGFSIFTFSKLGLSKLQAWLLWTGVLVIVGLSLYYAVLVKGYGADYVHRMKRKVNVARLRAGAADVKPGLTRPISSAMFRKKNYAKIDISNEDANALFSDLFTQVKEMKKDAADRMLPLLFALEERFNYPGNAEEHSTFTEDATIHDLIEMANYLIENGKRKEAARLYPQITLKYRQLPKEQRSGVYEKCQRIYEGVR